MWWIWMVIVIMFGACAQLLATRCFDPEVAKEKVKMRKHREPLAPHAPENIAHHKPKISYHITRYP